MQRKWKLPDFPTIASDFPTALLRRVPSQSNSLRFLS